VLHIVFFEFDTPMKLGQLKCVSLKPVIYGKHFFNVLPVQNGLKQGVNWAGHV